MAEFIKKLFPVAYKAFEDYQLNAVKFSAMEMVTVKEAIRFANNELNEGVTEAIPKQPGMTKREWSEFLTKVGLK
jgi:hypothetical protein